MGGRVSCSRALAAGLLVAALWAGTGTALGQGRSRGDVVVFEGLVTDAADTPLEGMRVVLEASRSSRSVTRPRRHESGIVRRVTRSGADGRYRFEWDWHSFYNRFRIKIVAGGADPKTDSDIRTVAELRIDKDALKQNPITSVVVVDDSDFVLEHREFASSVRSADERRIYEQMGKPDRVEGMHRDDAEEISWWYFERGQAYRFRYGRLVEVEEFDLITPF